MSVQVKRNKLVDTVITEQTLCGENLFDIEKWLTDNKASFTKDGSGVYTIDLRQELYNRPFRFKGVKQRYLLFELTNVDAVNPRIAILNGNTPVITYYGANNNNLQTNTFDGLRFDWSTLGRIKLKITVSDKPISSITPYNGQTIPISETLRGLDTQDEIYTVVDGNELVTKKIQRYGNYTFTGDEGWSFNESSNEVTCSKSIGQKYRTAAEEPNVITFVPVHTGNGLGAYPEGFTMFSNNVMRFKNSALSTLEQFISWIKDKLLVYELADPIITEISRVPIADGFDFERVENILTENANAGISDETTVVDKGVLKSAFIESMQINGQNLIQPKYLDATKQQNGATWINNNDGSFTVSGNITSYANYVISRMLPIKEGTYTVSGIENTTNVVWESVTYYDKNKLQIGNVIELANTKNAARFSAPFGVSYVNIAVKRHSTGSISGTAYPMLVLGSTATSTYTPYKAPQLISFGEPIELKGVGTANDRVYIEAKEDAFDIKSSLRTKNILLNGTEDWIKPGGAEDVFYTEAHDIKRHSNYKGSMICDKLEVATSHFSTLQDANNCVTAYADSTAYVGQNWIYLKLNGINSVDACKNYLSQNNLTITFELATPIETTLATGLTENQVAALIEKYGSVEVVGNTNEEFVKPDVTMLYQASRAVSE